MNSALALCITFLASFVIWGMVLLFLFRDIKAYSKQNVKGLFFAVALAWVLSVGLKSVFPSIRPFQINGYPPLTLTLPFTSSFPSSHTAFAFAMATYIYLLNKKRGALYIALAILVGFGRVISQAHFTLDVVGGALIGASTASLFSRK